ncbi:MAG TPA: HepT-like ribonuclease domain-containing protein [Thermoanaerobaculia bacterium]|nr:HepT-like ribonuclease domain-containing protein [Thermoanaerobaculia bacterium]
MLRFAREVVDDFTAGIDRNVYGEDVQIRRSVERSVQLVGESAKHVSTAFREAHPEIPWRKIIGQRNVLVHEYGEVDDDLVWNLVERELAPLIENLRRIVDAHV